MGWDAYGLPAEQFAVKENVHPRITTQNNIDNFRRQIKSLGFSYDWDREVDTTDPGYYKWTQWIFLKIYDTWYDPDFEWTDPQGKNRRGKGRPIAELPIPADCPDPDAYRAGKRLAYRSEVPVNWCPALGTVLANEEIIDGKSERGGHPVVRMPLTQWMLRITAYAERLVDDLEELGLVPGDQGHASCNWVGRSEGAEVDFAVEGADPIRVFTTRPDTLFGATYMVLAPEHSLVDRLTTPEQRTAVDAYREQATRKSDLDRTDLAKTKTGVFTGGHAINPVNGKEIPIWIADYVLMCYGTGAIMAVPGQDERDWEFAKAFGTADSAGRGEEARGCGPVARRGRGLRRGRRQFLERRDQPRRPVDPGGQAEDHRLALGQRRRRQGDQLQAARLALLAPALLGRTVPDSARHGRQDSNDPGGRPAGPSSRARGFQADRPA